MQVTRFGAALPQASTPTSRAQALSASPLAAPAQDSVQFGSLDKLQQRQDAIKHKEQIEQYNQHREMLSQVVLPGDAQAGIPCILLSDVLVALSEMDFPSAESLGYELDKNRSIADQAVATLRDAELITAKSQHPSKLKLTLAGEQIVEHLQATDGTGEPEASTQSRPRL